MDRRALFCLALLSFCFLASGTTEATTEASTETNVHYEREYVSPCYIEKTKVGELMIRMNQTVQLLNRKDEYLQCQEKVKIFEVEADAIEMCSEDQILRIQKELNEVTSRLLQLAIRLEEPSEEEVNILDLRKFRLIDSLRAIRVFYGHSPCDSSSIVLYPFEALVEYLEYNLNELFVLFQNWRPIRPPTPTFPVTTTRPTTHTTPMPTLDDMLSPSKSFQELTAMAHSNPSAMTEALPQIISERYNPRSYLLDAVLNFVQGLPTEDLQIIGFSAIYDKTRTSLPPLPQLLKLAENVKRLNDTVSASPNFIGTAAWFKLADVVHGLSPLVTIGEKATCSIISVPYQGQLVVYDPVGYPESAYIYTNQNSTSSWRIYPRIAADQTTFRIMDGTQIVYASDTNSNTNNEVYTVKPSERFVLDASPVNSAFALPVSAEIDWKIVPDQHIPGRFKILSAKYDDFMFVHKSATGLHDFRRVLLGKKNYPKHDHIPDADLWTLKCSPGNFTITDI